MQGVHHALQDFQLEGFYPTRRMLSIYEGFCQLGGFYPTRRVCRIAQAATSCPPHQDRHRCHHVELNMFLTATKQQLVALALHWQCRSVYRMHSAKFCLLLQPMPIEDDKVVANNGVMIIARCGCGGEK